MGDSEVNDTSESSLTDSESDSDSDTTDASGLDLELAGTDGDID